MKNKIIASSILIVGLSAGMYLSPVMLPQSGLDADTLKLDEQEATVRAIKKAMPSVVSIVVSEDQAIMTQDLATGKVSTENISQEKGAGSGFIISSDGLILTNKHVVLAGTIGKSDYRVILNSGKKYYAQLIGTDPINDLAVLKIFDKNLPFLGTGDSDKLPVGSSVIAIGNSLGRYQNSVTKGIVSGLGRSFVATDGQGNDENVDNAIQTDAEINLGNSGGPLIDLNGNVVGINVAVDTSGSAIGFAIPINDAKPVIKSVKEIGRIVRSRLGVQYIMLNAEIAADKKLSLTEGALIVSSDNVPAIASGSPAAIAGLAEGDIITEINKIKVTEVRPLLSLIQTYRPGNKIGLRIWRDGAYITKTVVLDEFK